MARSSTPARVKKRQASTASSGPADNVPPGDCLSSDVVSNTSYVWIAMQVAAEFLLLLLWKALCTQFEFVRDMSFPASHILSWLTKFVIHGVVSWFFHRKKPLKQAMIAVVSSFFAILILGLVVGYLFGLSILSWWSEPGYIETKWTRAQAHARTATGGRSIRCPRKRVANFMELPEEKVLSDIFSDDGVQKIHLLRGVSDSGKTTTLKQAICNVGAEHEAIYIAMPFGGASNVIFSYNELCTVFEDALRHLDVQPPPSDSRGLERFRHIISNIKAYQEHVGHRIAIIDDLHAVQFMGPEAEHAIKLIVETMIWIQKECGTRVVLTSSDGLFLDHLVTTLGSRLDQLAMGSVPVSECLKHARDAEHRTLLEAALSRTGTSLSTCVAFKRGSVEAVEAKLVTNACSRIGETPFVCKAIANPPHKFAADQWRPLRKLNIAEKMVDGAKLQDIFLMPAVKKCCAEHLEGANSGKHLPLVEEEKQEDQL